MQTFPSAQASTPRSLGAGGIVAHAPESASGVLPDQQTAPPRCPHPQTWPTRSVIQAGSPLARRTSPDKGTGCAEDPERQAVRQQYEDCVHQLHEISGGAGAVSLLADAALTQMRRADGAMRLGKPVDTPTRHLGCAGILLGACRAVLKDRDSLLPLAQEKVGTGLAADSKSSGSADPAPVQDALQAYERAVNRLVACGTSRNRHVIRRAADALQAARNRLHRLVDAPRPATSWGHNLARLELASRQLNGATPHRWIDGLAADVRAAAHLQLVEARIILEERRVEHVARATDLLTCAEHLLDVLRQLEADDGLLASCGVNERRLGARLLGTSRDALRQVLSGVDTAAVAAACDEVRRTGRLLPQAFAEESSMSWGTKILLDALDATPAQLDSIADRHAAAPEHLLNMCDTKWPQGMPQPRTEVIGRADDGAVCVAFKARSVGGDDKGVYARVGQDGSYGVFQSLQEAGETSFAQGEQHWAKSLLELQETLVVELVSDEPARSPRA